MAGTGGGCAVLEAMLEGWRGKRVLIVGKPDGLCAFLTAMLEEIGARLMRVGDRADAQALCRALTAGRIGAVILPEEMTGRDLPERLAATLTLIQEIREAGVPLLLALSDAAVYPSGAGKMNETAAIGGRTREGLEASILQTAILGAARGLTGDAVRTMLIRHAPTLGGQCADWCEALLNGEPVKVKNPTARGVFVHPLDVAGCALMLGAEAFRRGEGGVYHIGTDARSICTNRSAAQRLSMRHHGTAQIQKEETDGEAASVLLDGSAARRLCGAVCRLDADQALDLLFEQRKAAREGREAETIRKMARTYLEACRA